MNMSDHKFAENLLRTISAQLQFLSSMVAADAMFGRSYLSLASSERAAVDHAMFSLIGPSYHGLTKDALCEPTQQPIGF